jgi:CRISPR-associated endonuclease Cas2
MLLPNSATLVAAVQHSVFECEVDPAQWVKLRARLLSGIDAEKDRLRFYQLGANWTPRVEHVVAKPALDLNGLLVFCCPCEPESFRCFPAVSCVLLPLAAGRHFRIAHRFARARLFLVL